MTQPATAARESVAVIVVPRFDPSGYAERGAVGLYVPGAGATVTRERALASLVRGRVVSSLVDLDGKPVLRLAKAPATTTIYLELPAPGAHHNVVRYPVAVVGPGYHGLLTSGSTRISGLVSLADIAPTAAAIVAGQKPPIRAREDTDAVATLARLDQRLTLAHDARTGATLVLVGWLVAFSAAGVLARSSIAGRAAVLVAPVALTGALILRVVGVDHPTTVVGTLAVLTGAGSLPRGRPIILAPPFRSPHHGASAAAIVGGGAVPRPGEASLAHRGVLLLDELPEFPRPVLESLRQPLEDGVVSVARVGGHALFPARFRLVATMNLCPCGGRGDPAADCGCSPQRISAYREKVSRALLDRFDLVVAMPRPRAEELAAPPGEASATVRARVVARTRAPARR